MKRCPECLEVFEGAQKFCDADGAPLIEELRSPRSERSARPPGQEMSPNQRALVTAALGVIVGMMVCAAAFVIFFADSSDGGTASRQEEMPASPRRAARLQPPPPPHSTSSVLDTIGGIKAPTPEEQVTEEGVEEAEEEPQPQEPAGALPAAPGKTAPAARISRGLVSTGGRGGDKQDQALIQLTDGKTLEVDAVWEDSKGVWYRRGALVTFVERGRVKEITGKEEPAAAAPAP